MLETPIAQPSPAPSGKEKSPYQAERLRGVKEARTAIEALKVKWPAIFNDPKTIKPLASPVLSQVAAALGRSSRLYARRVSCLEKPQRLCRAVLRDSVRVHLDGSLSEEVVDDCAREMAKAQLDKNAARSAARRARELAEMTAKGA